MIYALIDINTNIVDNVIVGYLEIDGFICVPTEGVPVEAGDLYDNGYFYRDGERIYSALQEYQLAFNILLLGENAE